MAIGYVLAHPNTSISNFPKTIEPDAKGGRNRSQGPPSTDRKGVSMSSPVKILSLPWWLVAIVIFGACLMAAGAGIALFRPQMLIPRQELVSPAVRVYAGHLVSRNLALAIMLMIAMVFRMQGSLRAFVILTALIQVLDAVLDAIEGRWAVVPGVFIFAIAFSLVAFWLSRHDPRQTA